MPDVPSCEAEEADGSHENPNEVLFFLPVQMMKKTR